MTVLAYISGCKGTGLSTAERELFARHPPWGFILFRRNVETPAQVRALVDALRAAVGRAAPVLIDQEGGRVQRLRPPHWPAYPAAGRYLTVNDPLRRAALVRLGARLMADDLRAVGINVDCLPVLDVPVPGADAVIGDRAYASDVDEIARLGRAASEGLLAGGVLPVVKHMPGHGRAMADSHLALPVVEACAADLSARDFRPFRHLADMPLAMTAHVVFQAFDGNRPATLSRRVVRQVMRGEIGFDGLIMTDDLSMKALSGSFAERAAGAYAAGCDMLLHCNGEADEMAEVAQAARPLRGQPLRRARAALARIVHEPEPLDRVALAADIRAVHDLAG